MSERLLAQVLVQPALDAARAAEEQTRQFERESPVYDAWTRTLREGFAQYRNASRACSSRRARDDCEAGDSALEEPRCSWRAHWFERLRGGSCLGSEEQWDLGADRLLAFARALGDADEADAETAAPPRLPYSTFVVDILYRLSEGGLRLSGTTPTEQPADVDALHFYFYYLLLRNLGQLQSSTSALFTLLRAGETGTVNALFHSIVFAEVSLRRRLQCVEELFLASRVPAERPAAVRSARAAASRPGALLSPLSLGALFVLLSTPLLGPVGATALPAATAPAAPVITRDVALTTPSFREVVQREEELLAAKVVGLPAAAPDRNATREEQDRYLRTVERVLEEQQVYYSRIVDLSGRIGSATRSIFGTAQVFGAHIKTVTDFVVVPLIQVARMRQYVAFLEAKKALNQLNSSRGTRFDFNEEWAAQFREAENALLAKAPFSIATPAVFQALLNVLLQPFIPQADWSATTYASQLIDQVRKGLNAVLQGLYEQDPNSAELRELANGAVCFEIAAQAIAQLEASEERNQALPAHQRSALSPSVFGLSSVKPLMSVLNSTYGIVYESDALISLLVAYNNLIEEKYTSNLLKALKTDYQQALQREQELRVNATAAQTEARLYRGFLETSVNAAPLTQIAYAFAAPLTQIAYAFTALMGGAALALFAFKSLIRGAGAAPPSAPAPRTSSRAGPPAVQVAPSRVEPAFAVDDIVEYRGRGNQPALYWQVNARRLLGDTNVYTLQRVTPARFQRASDLLPDVPATQPGADGQPFPVLLAVPNAAEVLAGLQSNEVRGRNRPRLV